MGSCEKKECEKHKLHDNYHNGECIWCILEDRAKYKNALERIWMPGNGDRACCVAAQALEILHSHEQDTKERESPRLGDATCEVLLGELSARIEVHGPGLGYRTVD